MTAPSEVMVVLSTCPSEEVAASIGRGLVEHRLAACVNIVPAVRSLYSWEGRLCDDHEALMIVKTSRERIADLVTAIKAAHPYEVPEIVALPVEAGWEPYLRWVGENSKGRMKDEG